jgi:hypothetical protein
VPKTRTLLSLVAIPLLALLIACGGDKKDDSSSSSDGDSGGSSSSQSSGSSGDDRASSSDSVSLENCKEYASLETAALAAFGTSSSGQFKFDKGAFDKIVKASPKEIRADMQILVDALVGYFEVLDKAGLTDPSKLDPAKLQAAQADLEKAAAKMEEKKVVDASARVEAYFEKNCS